MARSRYDELHDKYSSIGTTKAGTRYERLAAAIFKSLDREGVVIHDVDLIGEDPEVKHQVDISIERRGIRRRVVIECKDFDISKDKVGLDIIRNFRSVIEDTGADEGIVVTCNGFTQDAQKYARSKGIKLAIIRKFEESDWSGRIRNVNVNVKIFFPSDLDLSLGLPEESRKRLMSELGQTGGQFRLEPTSPLYVQRDAERIHIGKFVDDIARRNIVHSEDVHGSTKTVTEPAAGWALIVREGEPIEVTAFTVRFKIDVIEQNLFIVPDKIAELIVSGYGDTDLVVCDQDLIRYKIDPDTGRVETVGELSGYR